MKKLKVKGIEVDESGVSSYGIDVEDKMLKILSEELAKEIDKDILRKLGFEPDRRIRRSNKIKKILDSLNNSR